MKYEQPPPMSRAELEEVFKSDSGETVQLARISAFYTEAGRWVQDRCLKLVDHLDPVARRGVAQVLGNIAAVHRNELDLMKCQAAVEKLTSDTDEEVRIAAQDSPDYVLHAIKLRGVS